MNTLNISEKGSFYICHRCLSFKSNSKNDIIRHFHRSNPCMPNIITNDDNIEDNDYFYNKSISHRYVTEMNINILEDIHFKIIVNNFNNEYNIITFDALNSFIKHDDLLIKKNNNINKYFNKIIGMNNIEEDNKNKKYKCYECMSDFSSLQKLKKHSENINYCNKKKQLNLLKLKSEKALNISTDEFIHKNDFSNQLINIPTQNILNQNNIQTQNILNQNNIQNIQNQNTNNQKNDNNFYLNTRDFLNESYDYSHLNIHNLNDKFFEYSNFLQNLLKNESNQNLYFTNNGYGIYYADNVLNKSQSEMIVAFIINKLKTTLESIMNQLNEEKQNEKRHLKKYYNKLDNQYKINSYYQNYDFDDKYFYNTEIKCRIRDKFVKETIRAYKVYLDDIKKKFTESELSKGAIENNKIKIENFLTLKQLNQDFL